MGCVQCNKHDSVRNNCIDKGKSLNKKEAFVQQNYVSLLLSRLVNCLTSHLYVLREFVLRYITPADCVSFSVSCKFTHPQN